MAHFYMVGFFSKRQKASVLFTREKPFEIDNKAGTVTGKCMCLWREGARRPRNDWPKEWFYCDWAGLKDIDHNKELQKLLNDVWIGWCKKYRRTRDPLVKIK